MFVRRWPTFSLLVASLVLALVAYRVGKTSGAADRRPVAQPKPTVKNAPGAVVRASSDSPSDQPVSEKFSEQWRNWQNELRTPVSERDVTQALRELARYDPARAMNLALGESNPQLMERLRAAVLNGWAANDPTGAANWAVALPVADRRAALVAVFSGAVEKPEAAALLGENLCRQWPGEAGDYGQLMISALAESGAYANAARFALSGGDENRPAWLNAAYYQWAMRQPEQALKAFGAITDPAVRSTTFLGLTAGWAEANPAAVASYALHLPAGSDRAEALSQMLSQWATRDPLTASEWMLKNLNPSADLDGGVAAVASLPSLISQRPEIAIGWAESIADPKVRSQTLTTVAQLWSQRDGAAARRYIETNTSLAAAERTALLKGLADTP